MRLGQARTLASLKAPRCKSPLTHGHSVLRECPCLVGADDRGTSQCLHCLQFTDQTVLGLHALGCQGETHLWKGRDGGEEGGRGGRREGERIGGVEGGRER